MAKRKITVTVDEALVEAAQELGHMSLSATVNAALAAEVDRRARAAALGRRQVGAILEATRSGSERIVDAHTVAVAVTHGGGLVVTRVPGDIEVLAAAAPAARIRTVTI